MSQFDEDEMWHFDSYFEPLEEEILGKLSIKVRKKKDVGPYVKDLIPGQIFRFAGSMCKTNLYMVIAPHTLEKRRGQTVYYLMLKNGKIYSSPRSERKRIILVSASLTLDD